jgi:hypothetical protein
MSRVHVSRGLVLAALLAAATVGAQSRYLPDGKTGTALAGGLVVTEDARGASFEVVQAIKGRLDIGVSASVLGYENFFGDQTYSEFSLGIGYALARPVEGSPFGVDVIAAYRLGDYGSSNVDGYRLGSDLYLRIAAGPGVTIYPTVGLSYVHTNYDWVHGPSSATDPLVTGQVAFQIGEQVVIEPGFANIDGEWQGSLAVRVVLTAGNGGAREPASSKDDEWNPW